MSDFGTLLLIKKADGSPFTEQQLTDLTAELESIIETNNFEDALGDPFTVQISQSDEETDQAVCLLSAHYFSGDAQEDEQSFQFVNDTEFEEANEIGIKLQLEFPDYDFQASVEKW